MHKLRALVLLLILLLLAAAPALADTTTVMVYLCGSNLESLYGSASADMQEMLISGFDPEEVNLVVMAGGSSAWQDSTFTPDALTIAVAQPKKRGSGLRFTAVETLPNASMGESDTLLSFITYARGAYPADRYALVLWDHGGGPMHGVCWDELYDADSLSVAEISSALTRAGLGGEDKLYFIGFDACLMGSLEVASAMAPFADYMIGSEETEPGLGWNYAFLGQIAADTSAADTGKRIVDGYFSAQEGTASVLTMACYDLSQVSDVCQAAETFFAGLGSVDTSNFSLHAEVRRAARGYGRAYGAGGDYDLVDLCGIVAADSYAETEGRDVLLNALDRMVVYSRSNASGSGGVSIFYPYYEPENYIADGGESYAAYTVSPAYLRYLSAFVSAQTGTVLSDWHGLSIVSDDAQNDFSLQLTQTQADNLGKAELLVLRGVTGKQGLVYGLVSRTEAGAPDAEGMLHAQNPRRGLTNALGQRPLPYVLTDSGHYRVRILTEGNFTSYGFLDLMDGEGDDLILADYFMYDAETDAFTNRHSFDVMQQDSWVIYYPTYSMRYDDSGVLLGFDRWTRTDDHYMYDAYTADCMRFRFTDVQDETWRLFAVWQITDTQGNTWCSDMVELNSVGHQTQPLIPQQTDGPLQVTDGWVTAYLNEGVEAVIEFTNTSDRTLLVEAAQDWTILSGQVIDRNLLAYKQYTLEPGQSQLVWYSFKSDVLYGLHEVNSLAVDVKASDPEGKESVTIRLEGTLAEPMSIASYVDAPDESQPLSVGENDGIQIVLISQEEQENGSLHALVRMTNDRDEQIKVDPQKTEMLINGEQLSDVTWRVTMPQRRYDDDPITLPPHSNALFTISFEAVASVSKWVDGSRISYLETPSSLADLGISELTSISLLGTEVVLNPSVVMDAAANGECLQIYDAYNADVTISEMRVEALPGLQDRWVIGLRATANNRMSLSWNFVVMDWLLNGQPAHACEIGCVDILTYAGESKTDWLYFITDQLPEGGVQSVGITLAQENLNRQKYWLATATITAAAPLDGMAVTAMKADSLHVDLTVEGIERVDEPEWHKVSLDGTLKVGEIELHAELMDAQVTDACTLSGWLRLTNDTDQRLISCAIPCSMFANGVQMIDDTLVIDAAIDAHSSTWQWIDIPLYAEMSQIRDLEISNGQEVLGFGPDMLGLSQLNKIGCSYNTGRYICYLLFDAVESIDITAADAPEGQLVLSTDTAKIELLAARVVPTENGTRIYTLLRGTNTADFNCLIEAGDPDKLGYRYLLLRSGMTGLFAISWQVDDPSVTEPHVMFRVDDDCSEELVLRANGADLTADTVWVPTLQAESVSSAESINASYPVAFELAEDAPFEVKAAELQKSGGELCLRVYLENKTDVPYYVKSDMIVCNGVTYGKSTGFTLEVGKQDYFLWTFSLDSYDLNLINTPETTEILIPIYYGETDWISDEDIRKGIVPCTPLRLTTQADTDFANTDYPVIGTGVFTANGAELPMEVLSIEQMEDSSLVLFGLVTNNTDYPISVLISNPDMVFFDHVGISGDSSVSRVSIMPGTKGTVRFKLDNKLKAPYTFVENSWSLRHPMLTNGLSQSGVSSFTQFALLDEDFSMNATLYEPFILQPAQPMSGTPLFAVDGWMTEVMSLSVMNDEANGRGLCLLVKVTHESGNNSLNPGVTAWYINGDRMMPDYAFFSENRGIPEGSSQILCLFMPIPEEVTEIRELKLFCVLNSIWPNKDDGLAEIVLTEPLWLDHTYTIPGSDITITPAQF